MQRGEQRCRGVRLASQGNPAYVMKQCLNTAVLETLPRGGLPPIEPGCSHSFSVWPTNASNFGVLSLWLAGGFSRARFQAQRFAHGRQIFRPSSLRSGYRPLYVPVVLLSVL